MSTILEIIECSGVPPVLPCWILTMRDAGGWGENKIHFQHLYEAEHRVSRMVSTGA